MVCKQPATSGPFRGQILPCPLSVAFSPELVKTRMRAFIHFDNCNWPLPGENALQLIAISVRAGVARLPLPHAIGLVPFWTPSEFAVAPLARSISLPCVYIHTMLQAQTNCVSCKHGILYPNSCSNQQRQHQQQQRGKLVKTDSSATRVREASSVGN
jgi:hypothetical protein